MPNAKKQLIRCPWPGSDELYCDYHDHEWGVPLYDDLRLFEFLILEGMQAGLSWITVLRKRESFRKAFAQFDPEKIARFSPKKVASLMEDTGIIRNRLKIASAVTNAQAFLKLVESQGSFSVFSWQFVNGEPKVNKWQKMSQVPAETKESKAFSKELKHHGFKFVGPTIIYAHMQACGMVNDHLVSCFRHKEVQEARR